MYGVTHMDGPGEDNPPEESLLKLYDELYSSGITDGEVSVINDDSGWGMSAHRDGRIVFEHLGGEAAPLHMIPVTKTHVLQLWNKLIANDIDGILSEPWLPGYSTK